MFKVQSSTSKARAIGLAAGFSSLNVERELELLFITQHHGHFVALRKLNANSNKSDQIL